MHAPYINARERFRRSQEGKVILVAKPDDVVVTPKGPNQYDWPKETPPEPEACVWDSWKPSKDLF